MKDPASTMEPLTNEEDIQGTDTIQDKKKIYVPTCNQQHGLRKLQNRQNHSSDGQGKIDRMDKQLEMSNYLHIL